MCDVKPLQRVGMLGGSFNPPHLGHIRLARTFITALHLDLVLFIPACIPPHKSSCGMVSAEDRCNMCRILIEKDAKIQVSDMEIRRGGASYTADTLQTLRAAYPKAALYLIVGADMFQTLQSWKDPQRIFSMAQICTVPRNTTDTNALKEQACRLKKLGARCIVQDIPVMQVSSTQVRDVLKNGGDVTGLTGRGVAQYICENSLYRE